MATTQSMTTTLDKQALEDIVTGACILGSGGGGPLAVGRSIAAKLIEPGATPVELVSAHDVPDDAQMAISAAFGSPTAATSATPDDFSRIAVDAYEALGDAVGRAFTHVLLAEIGAGNSLIPMLTAQAKGLPLVDASGAPRAMPLLANCVFGGADDVPVSPLAFSNGKTIRALLEGREEPETFIVTAPNAELADPLLRGVVSSSLFPDFGGLALWSMDGATMRANALSGTLTRAWKLGEVLRTTSGDKVDAVCAFLGGRVLFRGRNLKMNAESAGGFDVSTITLDALDGTDRLVIYAQNENLIAWRSAQAAPVAMAPDLICYLTAAGVPFSNASSDIGTITPQTEVAIIGVPAGPLGYATEWVIGSFAGLLSALGYPGPFVPLTVEQ